MVVAALRLVSGGVAGTNTRQPTRGAADSGANRGTMPAAYGGAKQSTDCGSSDHTSDCGVFLGARRSLAADRVISVLPARPIVISELVESLGAPGQRERTRACWHGRAAGEKHCDPENSYTHFRWSPHDLGVLCGTTGSQGVAHCCTYG